MTAEDDIWDNLFHGAAWRAYLEVYAATKQFPPDSETTRIRAYQLYEEALAEKNRQKQPTDSSRTPPSEAGRDCEAPEGGGKPHRSDADQSDLQPKSSCQNCLEDAHIVDK